MDRKLNYNCRLALTKGEMRTSNDIGLSYKPPYNISFEKKELGRIPNVEVKKPFAVSDTYSTTYNRFYVWRPHERDLTNVMKNFERLYTEYPQMRNSMPVKRETEYKEEYSEKAIPQIRQGWSLEQLYSCPIILTGKDEREPVPLTNNIAKYLDIYVSTARQDFRRYSEQEQKSIASKEIVTCHETMEIPKGRGYGMKGPALAGVDLERRDKNMTDEAFSKKEFKLRQLHIPLPMVPCFDITSEYGASYKEPTGFARRHVFDSFVEYPDKTTTSTTQAVCPPGMYSTDYDAINHHKSPQVQV